jgi:sugar fermentation stimulation protein A
MLYLVQRTDCDHATLATDIDPAYAAAFRLARFAGVDVLCFGCDITTEGVWLGEALQFVSPTSGFDRPTAK